MVLSTTLHILCIKRPRIHSWLLSRVPIG